MKRKKSVIARSRAIARRPPGLQEGKSAGKFLFEFFAE